MYNKVKKTTERYQMLQRGDTVTVALSGGADSMTLLFILLEMKKEMDLTVRAAHFNHQIRGAEADRDESFVSDYCHKNGVEIFTGTANVPEIASESGLGTEECGRNLRYAFLEKVSDGGKIATAHTLSDCEETFIFNLARGSSLRGLTSIPPVRGKIIRPLIDCSRSEIEAFCLENGIPFVTDSTNLHDDYTRNFIRHKILPGIKGLNSSFDANFGRCLEALRMDEEYLSSSAQKVFDDIRTDSGFLTEPLAHLHSSLFRRVAAMIIRDITGRKAEFHHIEALCNIILAGGSVQLSGGISVRSAGGELKIIKDKTENWSSEAVIGQNLLPNHEVTLELSNKDTISEQKLNKHLFKNSLDYDKISGNMSFSSFLPGDKIKLRGRGVTKEVRRLFNEAHIEPETRLSVPVLRDEEGPLWIFGFGVSERVAVTPQTNRALIISALPYGR